MLQRISLHGRSFAGVTLIAFACHETEEIHYTPKHAYAAYAAKAMKPRALALPAEDLRDEDPTGRGQRAWVPGEQEPELVGHAEHPLAQSNVRKNVVARGARRCRTIRRAWQEGHTPRFLHENATSRALPHALQRARRKLCA